MPSLCLCMIVKNESKIITRLFDSVLPIIDCYCICDTGSTDNTIELITNYFASKNITGKIITEPFKDFAHNRNFALSAASGMSDYALLMDADMQLIIGTFDKTILSTSDQFNILQGNMHYNYPNARIVRNDNTYKYFGVTHEYVIRTGHNSKLVNIMKDSLFIYDIGDGGEKIHKYDRDIALLTQGIADEPNNSRYYFYLGNSYHDIGKNDDAIFAYKKLLDMGGWSQEKYIACIKIYEAYEKKQEAEHGIHYLIRAHSFEPKRVEHVFRLVKYYHEKHLNDLAYFFYTLVADYFENEYLKNCNMIGFHLFARQIEYMYYLPHFVICVAHKLGKFELGIRMYEIIFEMQYIDAGDWMANYLIYNLQFFIYRLNSDTNSATNSDTNSATNLDTNSATNLDTNSDTNSATNSDTISFLKKCKTYLNLLQSKYNIQHRELVDQYMNICEQFENGQAYKNTIIGYIHICQIGDWKRSLNMLLTSIKSSGLYENSEIIRLCVVNNDGALMGMDTDISDPDKKFEIIYVGKSEEYERPTLLHMRKMAETDPHNTRYYYLHTKGLKHFGTPTEDNVVDWIHLMLYWNIEKWKLAIKELQIHDTYGCNDVGWHYSGNFWWATRAHILRLPTTIEDYYIAPENWVQTIRNNKYCVFNSGHQGNNHYRVRYPRELYADGVISVKDSKIIEYEGYHCADPQIIIEKKEGYDIVINYAMYDHLDITDKIKTIIEKNNGQLIINDRYNSLFTDPNEGTRKKIIIDYAYVDADSDFSKYIIIADFLINYISSEHYCLAQELEKSGWGIILQSTLNINFLKKQKCIILCLTFEHLDINCLKCSNIKLIYYIDDLYPYKEIINKCITECDFIFGSYVYLFADQYTNILNRPSHWIPHSAINKYFELISFNENPINKIFVSGYIDDRYPFRNYMIQLANEAKNIETLEHPSYGKDRAHSIIHENFYKKLNEYLCCFTDAAICKYTVMKVFEIAASGSLLLVDDSIKPQLNELGFVHNINCIMCNQNNIKMWIDWIFKPSNLSRINKIRRAGMELVRANHNIEERAKKINNIISKII